MIGFDEVVNKVRHHPVVLVPCHRSHFDYLILSYLFHLNFVSPPHIFAGVNMAFWPLAPFLRGAGAYFVRVRATRAGALGPPSNETVVIVP